MEAILQLRSTLPKSVKLIAKISHHRTHIFSFTVYMPEPITTCIIDIVLIWAYYLTHNHQLLANCFTDENASWTVEQTKEERKEETRRMTEKTRDEWRHCYDCLSIHNSDNKCTLSKVKFCRRFSNIWQPCQNDISLKAFFCPLRRYGSVSKRQPKLWK